MKKDFITVNDFTKEELLEIIEVSRAIKKSIKEGYYPCWIDIVSIDSEIEIENRHYTEEELNDLLPSFERDLEKSFLGENESPDFICHDVNFPDSIDSYPFHITYEWDDKEIIKRSGEISDTGSEKGKIVTILRTRSI